MSIKSGKSSTEFLCVAVSGGILALIVTGAVLLSFFKDVPIDKVMGSFTYIVVPSLAVITGAYAISRALVKKGNGGSVELIHGTSTKEEDDDDES